MDNRPTSTYRGPDFQEFIDSGPNDPAELATVSRQSRRPLKMARWQRWLIGAAALLSALIIGILLGRFVL
jgi:hypothetical protein